MGADQMFAWRVIYEADGSRQETVLAAADLLRAAEQVRQGLAAGEKILEIRSMAEVLPERAQPEPVAPPRPARRTGGTRQDQLLSVLEEVGEPVHLDVIADALDVNRAYADNIALRAIRAGLVARDGVGTACGKNCAARGGITRTDAQSLAWRDEGAPTPP